MRVRNKKTSQPVKSQNLQNTPASLFADFDGIQEGFERIGFDWKYLYLNEAAAGHYGRTPESLLGGTLFEAAPQEENSALYQQLRVCMEQRIPQHFGVSINSADGRKKWLQCSAYPCADGIFVISTSREEPDSIAEVEPPHRSDQ